MLWSTERSSTDVRDWVRTDRAVLAVNGFAADGNMFVKSVKQRLEVSIILFFCNTMSEQLSPVVPSCSCKRHASPCYCPIDTNNVVR